MSCAKGISGYREHVVTPYLTQAGTPPYTGYTETKGLVLYFPPKYIF